MNGAFPSSAAIPDPVAGDDDDVAWALQTAAVQWKRGLYDDAVVWLRRAADSAIQIGHSDRAADLIEAAASLADQIRQYGQQAKTSVPPPPPARVPIEAASLDDLLDAVDDEDSEDIRAYQSQPPLPKIGSPPPPPRGFGPSPSGASPSRASTPGLGGFPSPPVSPGFSAPPRRGPTGRLPVPPTAPPPRTSAQSSGPLPSFAQSESSYPPPPPQRRSITPFSERSARPSERLAPARESLSQRPTGIQPVSRSSSTAGRSSIPSARSLPPEEDDGAPKRKSLRALIHKLQQIPEEPLAAPRARAAAGVAPEAKPTDAEQAAQYRESLETPLFDRTSEARAEPDETPVLLDVVGETASVSDALADDAEPTGQATADRVSVAPPSAPASKRGDSAISILGVSLANVRGLQDLPEEEQIELVKNARLEALKPEEECSFFAVALVAKGWARIVPAISDTACAVASGGEVVFAKGNLEQGVALGIVAGEDGAFVAVWDQAALDQATLSCPWVKDELKAVADRFQALAGAALGPLGERLDETLRAMVTERCEVQYFLPGEVVIPKGAAVGGLRIVGAGRIEIAQGEGEATKVLKELGPGEFLFAPQVLVASTAPATARAGPTGAVLLSASRHETHELMAMVPPLIEILAG